MRSYPPSPHTGGLSSFEPLRFERIQPGADTFWIDPGGSIGCLLLHGWLGTPAQVRPLAERLAARGIACCGARLPGHGTIPEDLVGVRSDDWFVAAEAALQHVRRRKPHVFVGGLSLGGTLALHLAAAHPDDAWLRGIVTLAAPTRVRDWRLWLVPALRWVWPWLNARQSPEELQSLAPQEPAEAWTAPERYGSTPASPDVTPPDRAVLEPPLQHPDLLSYHRYPAVSLEQACRVMYETRLRLTLVRAPLLIIHGHHDRLIGPEDAQEIYDTVSSEDRSLLWLEDSSHLVPLGPDLEPDLEEVARVAAAFMQNRIPAAATHSPFPWPSDPARRSR